jgi:His/Glu/Gln/Arg/opine family amino acid ABC transporter permease subunit
MTYSFTLRTIFPYFGTLGDAAATTLLLSVLAILVSLALGAVFAVMRQSKSRVLRGLGTAYVEFMRNTPLLVILYFVYFVVPTLGLRLSSFSSALIALALNSGAYMTEILRAGLIAVPHGQFEAAASQGMTAWQALRHVVFPQVFRTIYAPLGNQFIAVILASSLASVIAVEDVASWMQTVGATSFRFFETFLVAAAVYLVMCQTVNLARIGIGRWLFQAARAS